MLRIKENKQFMKRNSIKSMMSVAAVATATMVALTACGEKPQSVASSEVTVEATSEAATSEVATEEQAVTGTGELLMATETMRYSADDVDGVVTTHKYNEDGVEVFTKKVDTANDMTTITVNTLDENGNIVDTVSYTDGVKSSEMVFTYDDHDNLLTRADETGKVFSENEYVYDDAGRITSETGYFYNGDEKTQDHVIEYTYDDTHDLAVKEVVTNQYGVETTERDFDTLAADDEYIETITTSTEDSEDDAIVYHKRVADNNTTYYLGEGSEVTTEYDEHGNMTKQSGKDALMGNFEQTFENGYDENGNLVSIKSMYNGDEGYTIEYTYDYQSNLVYDPAVDMMDAEASDADADAESEAVDSEPADNDNATGGVNADIGTGDAEVTETTSDAVEADSEVETAPSMKPEK